jgi:hypothetical protein
LYLDRDEKYIELEIEESEEENQNEKRCECDFKSEVSNSTTTTTQIAYKCSEVTNNSYSSLSLLSHQSIHIYLFIYLLIETIIIY